MAEGAMDHAPSSAEAPLVYMSVGIEEEEWLNKSREENIKRSFLAMEARMHIFPQGLRGDYSCVVPSVVSIGPYHHGLPHLLEMEKVKGVAALQFCRAAGRSVGEVYDKILSVAAGAYHCYYDEETVRRSRATWEPSAGPFKFPFSEQALPLPLSTYDSKFATMMFVDGCFLLQFMDHDYAAPWLESKILKDIMLLENQIPWLVLEALLEFKFVDVYDYVDKVGRAYFPKEKKKRPWWARWLPAESMPLPFVSKKCRQQEPSSSSSEADDTARKDRYREYRPAHLLGLLRFNLIRSMPDTDVAASRVDRSSSSLSITAAELAQMGVKLSASTASWFGDMSVLKKPVLGELSLSPLFLNDITARWLVNMVALEARTSAYVVTSYLSVLAMLMNQTEDVRELRERGVLRSLLSNEETLGLFKGLGIRLEMGDRFFAVLQQIEMYARNRPIRIALHKFVYNNYKVIATVFSIAAALAGLFKAIVSLKPQHSY